MIALYDEYDNFVGLLTAEDVVEQIVGEIYDETDAREAPPVERVNEGIYRVAGAALIEEVAQTLNLNALDEHQDVDTIGGLILKQLGRRPRPNDLVTIGPYAVTVESAQGFRINKLRFEHTGADDDDNDDDGVTPTGHTGV
jgi:CBS domain containing-hemolysin-like protein